VVENLVATAKRGTGPLRRYHKLRKTVLGLEEYHAYDQLVPLIEFDRKYEYEKVLDEIVESMKPLGPEYQKNVRQAFEGRWIDVYENPGKRAVHFAPQYGASHMLLNTTTRSTRCSRWRTRCGHRCTRFAADAHQPFVYSTTRSSWRRCRRR
jgi:oligoendopeptidase F